MFNPSNNLKSKMFQAKADRLAELSDSVEALAFDSMAETVFSFSELEFLKEASRKLLALACEKDDVAKQLKIVIK